MACSQSVRELEGFRIIATGAAKEEGITAASSGETNAKRSIYENEVNKRSVYIYIDDSTPSLRETRVKKRQSSEPHTRLRLVRKLHIRLLNDRSKLFRSTALTKYASLRLLLPAYATFEHFGFRNDLIQTAGRTRSGHEFWHEETRKNNNSRYTCLMFIKLLFSVACASASVATHSGLIADVGRFLSEASYCQFLPAELDPQGSIAAAANSARSQLVGFITAAYPATVQGKLQNMLSGGFTYGPFSYTNSEIIERGYYFLGVATVTTIQCAAARWPDATFELYEWQNMLMSGYLPSGVNRFIDAANTCNQDPRLCTLSDEEKVRRAAIKAACVAAQGKMAKVVHTRGVSVSKILGFDETHEAGCRLSAVSANFAGQFSISQGYTVTPLRVIQNLEIATPEELAEFATQSLAAISPSSVAQTPSLIEHDAALVIAAIQAGHPSTEAIGIIVDRVRSYAYYSKRGVGATDEEATAAGEKAAMGVVAEFSKF